MYRQNKSCPGIRLYTGTRFDDLKRYFIAGSRYVCRLQDKTGESYFVDATTPEVFFEVCLAVLTGRRKAGWYDIDDNIPEPPLINREQAAGLKGNLGMVAVEQWAEYDREVAGREKDARFLVDVDRVISAGSGESAFRLLHRRRGRENEGIKLFLLEGVRRVEDRFPF